MIKYTQQNKMAAFSKKMVTIGVTLNSFLDGSEMVKSVNGLRMDLGTDPPAKRVPYINGTLKPVPGTDGTPPRFELKIHNEKNFDDPVSLGPTDFIFESIYDKLEEYDKENYEEDDLQLFIRVNNGSHRYTFVVCRPHDETPQYLWNKLFQYGQISTNKVDAVSESDKRSESPDQNDHLRSPAEGRRPCVERSSATVSVLERVETDEQHPKKEGQDGDQGRGWCCIFCVAIVALIVILLLAAFVWYRVVRPNMGDESCSESDDEKLLKNVPGGDYILSLLEL